MATDASKRCNAKNTKNSRSTKVSLTDGLARLHESEEFSDLTVKLGEREWRVHKVVVCARSEFFHKGCTGKFKEAGTSIVTLHDDDPDAVDAMLRYLYTSEYPETSYAGHVRMFALAEKYLVEELQRHAATNFAIFAQDNWCFNDFADAIKEAYSTTNDPGGILRDAILQSVTMHASELLGNQDKYAKFWTIACTIPALSASIFVILGKTLANAARLPKYYYCCNVTGCQDLFICDMDVGDEVKSECLKGHTAIRVWNEDGVKIKELQPFQRVYAP